MIDVEMFLEELVWTALGKHFRKAWEKNKEDYVLSQYYFCVCVCMWNNTSFQILHMELELQSKEHFF